MPSVSPSPVSPPVSPSHPPSDSGDLLRQYPDFVRLLLARISGTAANQMLAVALGWQMYEVTHDAWLLGLVGLAQFLPALLLTLPAGHWVDRHDRRHLLTSSLGLQALVAAVLSVASLNEWIAPWCMLAMASLLGVARAFQMPSLQALGPSLVPARLLPAAVAANSSAMQLAVVVAPALGGVLYAQGSLWSHHLATWLGSGRANHLGAAVVYGVSLLLLTLAATAVLAIRHRPEPVTRPAPDLAALTAGIRFVWQRPVLLGALSLDLFAVLLGGATALLPIFAHDILHVGPEGLGLLRAAPAAGAVLVGFWIARHPVVNKAGQRLLGAVAIYGLATIVFGLTAQFWVALAALAVSGAADMISVVIRQSMVQLETPDEMRGRVAAVNSVFIGASNQLGEFESGATAAWLGPVGSVLLGGLGTLLVVAAWVRLFPDLARRDRLHGD
jgi:MFS family permease